MDIDGIAAQFLIFLCIDLLASLYDVIKGRHG